MILSLAQWHFLKEEKWFIMLFKTKYFYYHQQKQTNQTNLANQNTKATNIFRQHQKEQKNMNIKILIPKQMLQRSPIALVQVKAGNTSKHLMQQN